MGGDHARSRWPVCVQRRCCFAFTIIELLITIAIIALLLGILLPALGRSRQTAQRVNCLNHIRNLLIATQSYVHDHAYYPQPFQDTTITNPQQRADALWFNALDPYLYQERVKSALAADRNQHAVKQDPVWQRLANPQSNRTLKMNQGFGNYTGQARFFREFEVYRPAITVVFADGRAHDLRFNDGVADDFHLTEGTIGLRHDGGANVGFADGHASLEKQPIRLTPTHGDRVWIRHGTDFVWELE